MSLIKESIIARIEVLFHVVSDTETIPSVQIITATRFIEDGVILNQISETEVIDRGDDYSEKSEMIRNICDAVL
jgi:hypothetical protein